MGNTVVELYAEGVAALDTFRKIYEYLSGRKYKNRVAFIFMSQWFYIYVQNCIK